MKLVGLSGKSKAGKSTLAKALEEKYGWHRVSLANSLKLLVKTQFGLTDEQVYGKDKDKPCGYFHSDGISPRTARDILMWLGLAYRQVDPNFWIKQLEPELREDKINVIDDIRFPNEAKFVLDMGGFLIRVERAMELRGGDINDISETALDDFTAFHGRIPESWNADMGDVPGLAYTVNMGFMEFENAKTPNTSFGLGIL